MPQPNMNQMMKQVQNMQKDMVAAQEQLAKETVTSSAASHLRSRPFACATSSTCSTAEAASARARAR